MNRIVTVAGQILNMSKLVAEYCDSTTQFNTRKGSSNDKLGNIYTFCLLRSIIKSTYLYKNRQAIIILIVCHFIITSLFHGNMIVYVLFRVLFTVPYLLYIIMCIIKANWTDIEFNILIKYNVYKVNGIHVLDIKIL